MKYFKGIFKFLTLTVWLGIMVFLTNCEKHSHQEHKHATNTLDSGIVLPSNQLVLSDQGTVKAIVEPVKGQISIPGYVSPDPRRNEKVSARFGGRIEKLYFRYNYQYVKKGERIMDIYSPELNTYQDEYLYLFKSTSDKTLISNGRKKLILLGMTDRQINDLEKKGIHTIALSVFSPASGYLIFDEGGKMPSVAMEENKQPPSGNGMAGNMSDKKQAISNLSGERIREGSYITEGQALFSVNDLKEVWGIFSLDNRYEPLIKIGLPVEINSELQMVDVIHAKVNFVEPEFKEEQKFIQIRTYLDNPKGLLKVNSLLTGKMLLKGATRIQIPSSSIYDLGTRKIVWVYTGKTSGPHKVFAGREVVTGITAGELTEIISGLQGSEILARDAGYMIDSESLLPSDSL